jgi:hypothetical protein
LQRIFPFLLVLSRDFCESSENVLDCGYAIQKERDSSTSRLQRR